MGECIPPAHRRSVPQISLPINTNRFEPTIDIVVLMEETNIKCQNWKLGRIINLRYSDDGKIRAVNLKLGNVHIITCPQSQLYPLELSVQDSPEVRQTGVPVDENVEEVKTVEISYNWDEY